MNTKLKWLSPLVAVALAAAPSARAAEQPAKAEKPAAKTEAAATKEVAGDAPRIKFDKESIDKGDVLKGEPARFEFTFENTGKSELVVKEAKPSCGCTVADFTKSVKPGGKGTVVATIDTSRFKGPITKSVSVTSNDPTTPTVHLQAKANIKSIIDVSPSENVYFRVFRGDDQPTKRVLTITSDAENKFTISTVKSTNPAITTNLIDNSKDAKGGDPKLGGNYTLEVDVKKDAPIGPLTGVVTVETSSPKVPKLTLNVNGQVLGEVLVTPQKVYLGSVTKDTASSIKRTVRIEKRTGADFKIEKVESTNASLKAEVSPVEEGKVYTLTISVTGDLPAGAINANILVKTNDKEQATVEIPVIGTVAG